jgi:NADH-quinone oxidoreductase subunit F
MDLKISGAAASAAERAAIDAHVAARGTARDQLLPLLHAINDGVGWISPGAVEHLASTIDVAPAEIFAVASFYDLFSLEDRPGPVVRRCVDIACQVNGAAVAPGEHASPCLGLCDRAPAALVVEAGAPPRVEPPLGDAGVLPQHGDPGLVLLRRVGVVDPGSLDDYRATGGYQALRRATWLGAAGVLRELTDSGLVGRGGAAFPAGRKWSAVAAQPARPKYVVVNADESEPGTFKDRIVMERDPFALVEAATIAGFAVGAERGYVYLRGEYPEARHRLAAAIEQAYGRGLLGDDVMGLGFRFDLELRIGAGAYICGEETALFNSLEGFRGEPRSKPPFPVEVGLFGKPTLVNNVETLINVLPIVLDGGLPYAETGAGRSTGTKLYCVSGRVERPGLYELPFGATLRQLLALAEGVARGRPLQAVLIGGAAGAFLTADELDTPLTFEGLQAAGATLGSGVIVVLDDTVELGPVVARIAAFFRHESCGQCVPCRVGTQRQVEALERLARPGADRHRELTLLADLDAVMTDASICGLGQTAASAVRSALAKFDLHRHPPTSAEPRLAASRTTPADPARGPHE